MTKSELIAALQNIPGDPEVMIQRGEWGPSRIRTACLTVVRDSGDSVQNWEVYDVDIVDDPEVDRPRQNVVLID